ncbi:hypothetical protein M670_04902 [Schinkia azotoformans MEV2011]|uniref:Uncharacterized protein n=2 Tax=Schinkia azotoformans TaxID=1454 RepID=A0A072NE25_SCHAZ|nr:hypothetical protein [Schinkia azotoformans]KEF35929.1 hypothetical protein M670_04902 [Schinkia azotoformans MEV2011]MEC1697514.1 hypothetical protein [Schinkia azotoformans]MEC1723733.1 hypothetical protein [Schinkia azotoformans]MEC1773607.1 hypothetical protein [Schinkia azotoformans]MEC1778555.1 hypothetical protein [Schinkia azotoformans]
MKKFIYFLFGKPYTISKFFSISYWITVGFYFFVMTVSVVQTVIYGGWISLLFFAIIFPVLFRVVYKVNYNILKGLKGMNKRVILILGLVFGLFTVGMFAVALLFGDNVSIGTSKSVINGEVKLSIGSLKGYHDVESFDVTKNRTVSIPYIASVGEGSFYMYVEGSKDTVWEDEITDSKNEVIEFPGEIGTYTIGIYTEEAKKIKINLSLD